MNAENQVYHVAFDLVHLDGFSRADYEMRGWLSEHPMLIESAIEGDVSYERGTTKTSLTMTHHKPNQNTIWSVRTTIEKRSDRSTIEVAVARDGNGPPPGPTRFLKKLWKAGDLADIYEIVDAPWRTNDDNEDLKDLIQESNRQTGILVLGKSLHVHEIPLRESMIGFARVVMGEDEKIPPTGGTLFPPGEAKGQIVGDLREEVGRFRVRQTILAAMRTRKSST